MTLEQLQNMAAQHADLVSETCAEREVAAISFIAGFLYAVQEVCDSFDKTLGLDQRASKALRDICTLEKKDEVPH